MASPRHAASQVLVDDLDRPVLDRDQRHHLGRVLRLRAGETVVATDGAGQWRLCSFDGDGVLEPSGDIATADPPPYRITVGFALVKGGKAEPVVQKLTELGVDHIVPFHAGRSVVRWDAERAAKHLARLDKIAREACAQCRRMYLPRIGWGNDGGVGGIPHTTDLVGAGAVVADGDGRPLEGSDRFVLIGPEGGWDPDEVASASAVSLAPLVLRADTAAIAAGVLMGSLRAQGS